MFCVHIQYQVKIRCVYTPTNFPEIEDQEVEGEPSESFKEEIQEYFNEQVEVESSDGEPHHINETK